MANYDELLQKVEKQEQLFKFEHFNHNDAWDLGNAIFDVSKEQGFCPAISIRLNNGFTVFQYGFEGTGLDHESWMEKKARTVFLKEMSSFRVDFLMKKLNATMADWYMDSQKYSLCGGGFPIYVKNTGMIGVILLSGISIALDHDLIIQGLSRYFEISDVPHITDEELY
jgi:uncharacterized protein (UPF0303 family)